MKPIYYQTTTAAPSEKNTMLPPPIYLDIFRFVIGSNEIN